jgi:hypothetical protein
MKVKYVLEWLLCFEHKPWDFWDNIKVLKSKPTSNKGEHKKDCSIALVDPRLKLLEAFSFKKNMESTINYNDGNFLVFIPKNVLKLQSIVFVNTIFMYLFCPRCSFWCHEGPSH